MKVQSSKPFLIQAPAQVRALVSPARQEIVDALVAAGPCSIAELAAHTGRAPDSLYFHIRRLVKVGLVLELDPRKSGRHIAAIYDVPGPLFLRYDAAPPRALQAVIAAALRLGNRDFAAAVQAGDAVTEGEARALWGGRVKGWLDHDDLLRINKNIREIFETFRSARPGPDRHAMTFSFALAPVTPNPRSASKASTHDEAESEDRSGSEGSDPSLPGRRSVQTRPRPKSPSRPRSASRSRLSSRTSSQPGVSR